MEAKLAEPAQEGQEPKSPSKVLSEILPNIKFLHNVGLESTAPNRRGNSAT
ncbi:hypothetical protein ACP4OV_030470 [Aristida adscensionis]